jgi:hypothetical protein
METLESEVVELLETSKYSNLDVACKYMGKNNRRIIVYYLYKGGYISYYEATASSNLWEVTVNMPGLEKEDYALAQSRVIRLLPENHMVKLGETVTEDGLRNWNKQIFKGYEFMEECCNPYYIHKESKEEHRRIKVPLLKYTK